MMCPGTANGYKEVTIMSDLPNPFFQQGKLIPIMTPLLLRYERSGSDVLMKYNAGKKGGQVTLEDFRLEVKRYRLKPEISTKIIDAITKNLILKYPVRDRVDGSVRLDSGKTIHQHLFTGKVPSLLVVCFVTNATLTGNSLLGHQHFHRPDVRKMYIDIDNQHFPGRDGYKFEAWGGDLKERNYFEYLKIMRNIWGDSKKEMFLTYEKWIDSCFIVPFDLTPGGNYAQTNNTTHETNTMGTVKLYMECDTAVGDEWNVFWCAYDVKRYLINFPLGTPAKDA